MFYFIRSKSIIISAVLLVIAVAAFVVYGYFDIYKIKNDQSPVFSALPELFEIGVDTDVNTLISNVSASDREDGDVSSSIIIQSMGAFNDDMTRDITFAAFDSANHTSLCTGKIRYTDYKSPEFYLTGPLVATRSEALGIIDIVGAKCVLDGDLSSHVKIEDELHTDPGVYPYTVSVQNSAGDISKITLTVEIVSSKAGEGYPELELEDYLIYIPKGQQFLPLSVVSKLEANCTYTKVDEKTGETSEIIQKLLRSDITVDDGGLDTSAAGTYQIDYSVSNMNGKTATAHLTVVVR